MQVSPVDIQAWASDTGSEYPATAAEKAAVLPAVAAWKAEQLADAKASRSDSAINPLAVGAGAAGLGLAGLVAFNHFRKQGLSEPAAAAMAKQAENTVAAEAAAATVTPVTAAARSTPGVPRSDFASTLGPNPVAVTRNRPQGRKSVGRVNRQLAVLAGASRSGTNQSRLGGEYNLKSPFNDEVLGPRLAAANTPELRQQLVADIAQSDPALAARVEQELTARSGGMVPVTAVATVAGLPGAAPDGTAFFVKNTRETLVRQGGKWLSASPAGVRSRLGATGSAIYGSADGREIANEGGSALQLGRRNSGQMFQPGWFPDRLIYDDDGQPLIADNRRLTLGSSDDRAAGQSVLAELRRAKAVELGLDTPAAQRLLALGGNLRDANVGVDMPASDIQPKLTRGADGKLTPVQGSNGETVLIHSPAEQQENLAQIYADTEDQATKGLMEGLPASRSIRVGLNTDGTRSTEEEFYGFDSNPLRGLRVDGRYLGHSPLDLEIGGRPIRLLDRRTRTVEQDGIKTIEAEYGLASDKEGWYPATPGVDGLSVQTPARTTAPAARAYVAQVPAAESTNAYQGLLASYQQQEGAVISPALHEALRGRPEVLAEQRASTTYADLSGTPLSLAEIFDRDNPIPKAVQHNGRWIAPLQSVPVLAADGSVRFDSRPALSSDLRTFAENRGPDGSPYYGRTSTQVASAQQAPFHDYSKPGLLGRDVFIDQKPYIQKEPTAFLPNLAGQLNGLRKGEIERLGRPLSDSENLALADQTARSFSAGGRPVVAATELLDAAKRLTGELELTPGANFQAPAAHAVGGHTNKDWATQVLSSMAVTPRQDSWTIEAYTKSADPQDKARLANSWLNANPGIAEVLSSNLAGTSVVEQFGIVAEAYGAAARDFGKAIEWAQTTNPELADRARMGTPGGFGFDQFAKSYVRRHVIGRVAQLKGGTGASASPLNLPAAVGELVLGEAVATGRRPEEVLQKHVGASASPIDAVWKLDGIVSNAATDRIGRESYTNGSLLAERFWDSASSDTEVGKLKLELGAKTDSHLAPEHRSPLGSATARLPIAVKFGTNLAIDHKAFIDSDTSGDQVDSAIDAAVNNHGLKRSATGSDPASSSSRQFALNKVLSNQKKGLNSKIQELKGTLNDPAADKPAIQAQIEELGQRIQKLGRRQTSIDNNRLAIEQGVASFNRQGRDDNGQVEGSGFVLDFHPRTGRVEVQPDSFAPTVSLEGLQRSSNPDDANWDQDTLENTALDQGQRVKDVDAADIAPQFSLDTGVDPIAKLNAEVAQGRENLTRAGYGEAWQERRALETAALAATDTPRVPVRMQPGTVRSSAVPQAAQDQLNTLRSSLERPVTAAYSTQELDDARARHIMSYIQSAATPSFDKAGRQTSGWTGGDSHHGGARLAGRADRNVGAYNAPSEAMLGALALAARRRTGAL